MNKYSDLTEDIMSPVEVIEHSERIIDKYSKKLLHCIMKLDNLPVKLEHLEETSIAETINSLRNSYKEIDLAAETLAEKWKSMVRTEEWIIETNFEASDNNTNQNFTSHEHEHRNNSSEDFNGEPKPELKIKLKRLPLAPITRFSTEILDNGIRKRRYSCDDDLPESNFSKYFCLPPTTDSEVKYLPDTTTAEEMNVNPSFASFSRTEQTSEVPNLVDICINVLQNNIDAMEYTGGVPFEFLEPILKQATPSQLNVFEQYNSYVMEDSDILWKSQVLSKHPTKNRYVNESWREMFMRCQNYQEQHCRTAIFSKIPPANTSMIKTNDLIEDVSATSNTPTIGVTTNDQAINLESILGDHDQIYNSSSVFSIMAPPVTQTTFDSGCQEDDYYEELLTKFHLLHI